MTWQITTLGSLAEIVGGGTPSTSNPELWEGDIPWFTPAEIPEHGAGVVTTSARTISEAGLKKSAARLLPEGSVLVTSRASIGHCAIAGLPAATNQGFASLIPKDPRSTRFLYYWIQQHREHLKSKAAGSTFLEISASSMRNIPILAPTIPEQLEIGHALTSIDETVSTIERLIDKKEAVKQGTMQQLLTGRTRLPGHTKTWPNVTLGDSGAITGGGVDKNINPREPRTLLLNYTDVYNTEFIDRNSAKQIVTAPPTKISQCSIKSGDVFFTPSSETPDDIARSAVASEDLPDTVYSYHLVRWRPNSKWDPTYLAYAFSTEEFRIQASTLAAGSGTRYVISMPGFRSLKIPRPPLEEQQRIGKFLRDISTEINTLHRRREKAFYIKSGMMQQLLTGRKRLPVEVSS